MAGNLGCTDWEKCKWEGVPRPMSEGRPSPCKIVACKTYECRLLSSISEDWLNERIKQPQWLYQLLDSCHSCSQERYPKPGGKKRQSGLIFSWYFQAQFIEGCWKERRKAVPQSKFSHCWCKSDTTRVGYTDPEINYRSALHRTGLYPDLSPATPAKMLTFIDFENRILKSQLYWSKIYTL